MRPVRVVSIGPLPVEWGGSSEEAAAHLHRNLVDILSPGSPWPSQVVGLVTSGTFNGCVPVPCHTLLPNEGENERLRSVLADLAPDAVLLLDTTDGWAQALNRLAPKLPLVGLQSTSNGRGEAGAGSDISGPRRDIAYLHTLVVSQWEHVRRKAAADVIPMAGTLVVGAISVPPRWADIFDPVAKRHGVVLIDSRDRGGDAGLMLDVAVLIPDLSLTLIGTPSGEKDRLLRGRDPMLIERVAFLDNPTPHDRMRAMMNAEIVCVPGEDDAVGSALIEALAMGTPILGFKPIIRELGAKLGLRVGMPIGRHSKEAIASAIEQMRTRKWDHRLLHRATHQVYSATKAAANIADILVAAGGPAHVPQREIRRRVARLAPWHYAMDLDGIRTPIKNPAHMNRHRQRKAYFFDPAVQRFGGSLAGKTVLDLGCNAGFWSLAAIQAGCKHVLGIDGRPEHVEQANLVFEANRIDRSRYTFREGDVLKVDLGQSTFDIVLCLGLLYHVNDPVGLFQRLAHWTRQLMVIDTSLWPKADAAFLLHDESVQDRRNAILSPLVMRPTREAVIHLGRASGFDVQPLQPEFTDYTGALDFQDGRRLAFHCIPRAISKDDPGFHDW